MCLYLALSLSPPSHLLRIQTNRVVWRVVKLGCVIYFCIVESEGYRWGSFPAAYDCSDNIQREVKKIGVKLDEFLSTMEGTLSHTEERREERRERREERRERREEREERREEREERREEREERRERKEERGERREKREERRE